MANERFTVLTLDDESEIQGILKRCRGDILLDPRYLRIFQDFNKQRVIYFYWKGDQGEILQAFFERPLPQVASGGEKDLLSPWYYGGPIHSFTNDEAAQEEYRSFLHELDAYANDAGIVSQFQRLNPALDNYRLYGTDPNIIWNRKVVSIDLGRSLDTIRAEYDYKVRKNLRRAEKEGLRVERGATPEAIAAFKKVYGASMDRKAAGTFYYFNDKFYSDLFRSFPDEAQLFTVYQGSDVVASSLVLGNGKILHDYLRAAYPQFLSARPSDCVVDAIVAWAKGAGYEQYSLGGGHSTKEDDSLLGFKKSFSPTTKDFYVYKKIHNRAAYTARAVAEGKSPQDLVFEAADFFPEYKTS
jgi:serine/alanine adding enzyme